MLAALLVAVAAPVDADAAKRKKKKRYPTITSVDPMTAAVGDTLTLRGKNYRRGKGRNSVVFKAEGQRAYFVTADISTKKQLKVVIPKRLEEVMVVRDGQLLPTRFRLRVQARRLGKKFTSLADSPTIGPEPAQPTPGQVPVGPPPEDGDCDGDGVLNGADADDDGDALADSVELTIKTDQCKFDTDGDGVHDGYEYRSAIDLNDDSYQRPNQSLPYPAKTPYPNPLVDDKVIDHDGDGLRLLDEYRLWQAYGNPSAGVDPGSVPFLYYSAGARYSLALETADGRTSIMSADDYRNPDYRDSGIPGHPELKAKVGDFINWAQNSGYWTVRLDGPVFGGVIERNLVDFNLDSAISAAPSSGVGFLYVRSEQEWFDFNNDDKVSDDERDEDADGLTNFDEVRGRMRRSYWTECYGAEKPFQIDFANTDLVDADSDGDGVRDGADDQDFDGVPNLMELSRNAATGRRDWKQVCQVMDGLDPDEADPMPEHGYRNPFNPCLPDLDAPSCPVYVGEWAPYGAGTPNYFVLQ